MLTVDRFYGDLVFVCVTIQVFDDTLDGYS